MVVKKSVMKTRVGVKNLIKIAWCLLLFKFKIDQKGLMGWLGLVKIAVGSLRWKGYYGNEGLGLIWDCIKVH